MSRIFGIGHSTRSLAELLDLLASHAVRQLADIRSFPASRRHPHFARPHLEQVLPAAGVAYRWRPALGGLRRPEPGSRVNAAWRIDGFRAYADWMQGAEFAAGRSDLETWASAAPTAFLCAEADFRQCHRQLLADALVARGWEVLHIESPAAALPHVLTSFARVGAGGQVTYPGNPELPFAGIG